VQYRAIPSRPDSDATRSPSATPRANIGILIQSAPQIFGELMGEMFGRIATGVLTPGHPTVYDLADGPKALAELESRATIGKLALLP